LIVECILKTYSLTFFSYRECNIFCEDHLELFEESRGEYSKRVLKLREKVREERKAKREIRLSKLEEE